MSLLRIRRCRNMPTILNHFLPRIILSRIYPPFNSNANILAAQMRYGTKIRTITAKILLKRNVKREAIRLRMYNVHIINLATEYIWNTSTAFQRDQFATLAASVNTINQNYRESFIYRMTQITTPQETNCALGNDFLNGSNF
ncbi:10114_t:CDS:1 [Funneliformis geosporum]|uniref:19668_t:CDS:1 n=1 Tax=Funneliformis geosporum TaxID=1117311 RepID=A0A9W4SK22_9GLOM|nr:19668_t:CDS:1 [Funneliformis geosporum]CAI2184298.1 10114_t:CDS:1 [Funneliformis geosporum]